MFGILFDLVAVTGLKYIQLFTASGIVIPFLAVFAINYFRKEQLFKSWFAAPSSWVFTIGSGVATAIALALATWGMFSLLPALGLGLPDYSRFATYIGDSKAVLIALPLIWLIPAFMEEVIDRAFLINRLEKLIGSGLLARIVIVLLVSAAFGLAHPYQGWGGMVAIALPSTLYVGLFYLNRGNLWANVLAHGLFDTAFLLGIYWSLIAAV
jgi:membrane protease YdiL (CAAX protease family)